jgi:hypothetical protein
LEPADVEPTVAPESGDDTISYAMVLPGRVVGGAEAGDDQIA